MDEPCVGERHHPAGHLLQYREFVRWRHSLVVVVEARHKVIQRPHRRQLCHHQLVGAVAAQAEETNEVRVPSELNQHLGLGGDRPSAHPQHGHVNASHLSARRRCRQHRSVYLYVTRRNNQPLATQQAGGPTHVYSFFIGIVHGRAV